MRSTSNSLCQSLLLESEDRKKTKNIKHNKNIPVDDVIEIAKVMRSRSMAKDLSGTLKEILDTCVSILKDEEKRRAYESQIKVVKRKREDEEKKEAPRSSTTAADYDTEGGRTKAAETLGGERTETTATEGGGRERLRQLRNEERCDIERIKGEMVARDAIRAAGLHVLPPSDLIKRLAVHNFI